MPNLPLPWASPPWGPELSTVLLSPSPPTLSPAFLQRRELSAAGMPSWLPLDHPVPAAFHLSSPPPLSLSTTTWSEAALAALQPLSWPCDASNDSSELSEPSGSGSGDSPTPDSLRPGSPPSPPSPPVRRTHREIDAERRRRENCALRRLERLTERAAEVTVTGEATADLDDARAARSAKLRKRDKVAVLQCSATEIERLRGLVRALLDAPTHPRTAQSMADRLLYMDARNALSSSLFMDVRMSLLIMDLDSGRVLDVNGTFTAFVGWSREEMVGSSLPLTTRALLRWEEGQQLLTVDEVPDGLSQAQVKPDCQSLPASPDDPVVCRTRRLIQQYPASLALAKQLAQGKLASFTCTWRCVWKDGRGREMPNFSVSVLGEAGTGPLRVMLACNVIDGHVLDL